MEKTAVFAVLVAAFIITVNINSYEQANRVTADVLGTETMVKPTIILKPVCSNNVVTFNVTGYCGMGVRGGFNTVNVTCKDGSTSNLSDIFKKLTNSKDGEKKCANVQAWYEKAVAFCVSKCRLEKKKNAILFPRLEKKLLEKELKKYNSSSSEAIIK